MSDDYPFAAPAGPNDDYPFTVSRRAMQGFGWRPDQPDHRDIFHKPKPTRRPASADLTAQCPPVYSQGLLASGSANAIAAAVQFVRMKQKLPDAGLTPSRLFLYFGARVIEGTVAADSGAALRDGIKVAATDGVCFESGPNSWPYDIKKFAVPPPQAMFAAAKANRVGQYRRLQQDIAQMEACLAEGFPFLFGFSAFAAIQGAAMRKKTALLPMPGAKERPIGGHAALAIGYDRAKKLFKVRNSWGDDWGQGGNFFMPYDYLASPNYAGSFWTIRLVKKR